MTCCCIARFVKFSNHLLGTFLKIKFLIGDILGMISDYQPHSMYMYPEMSGDAQKVFTIPVLLIRDWEVWLSLTTILRK